MGKLRELLADHPRATYYAVADAAVLDGLLAPMYALGRGQFACLLAGDIAPDVAHVAPYLIALALDSPLVAWLESRLDLPWGYVIEANQPLLPLQLHLRRFSETRGPHGEPLLFRFWDPRVLRMMPPILKPVQGQAFMEGMSRIYLVQCEQDVVSVAWHAPSGRLLFSDEVAPATERGGVHHAGV